MNPLNVPFHPVWRIPVALALLTAFGLLAALLGTGVWRWAAWLCIATPVSVMFYFLCFQRQRGDRLNDGRCSRNG